MSFGAKVLIADDEERFRNTMCKLLTLKGLTACAVGSGPEAIDEIKRNSYDVLILDVRMPEMNGVQVLAEVKKIDPELAVIIMTGYASVDTAKDIMSLGAYDYMLKPYSTDELMEKIEAAYDRKVARAQLTGSSS
jgi:DNA-binding NtrC family response regulator